MTDNLKTRIAEAIRNNITPDDCSMEAVNRCLDNAAQAVLDIVEPKWTKPEDALPEKPNTSSYEQIDCWVIRKGRKSTEHLVWNCEHLCWDDSTGDDFECAPLDVECWMPMNIPTPPKKE